LVLKRVDSAASAIASIATQRTSLMIGLLGIIVSIGLYHIAKEATVPLWALFYVLLAWLITSYILVDAIRLSLNHRPRFPSVVAVLSQEGSDAIVLMTDPSDLLGTGNLVSIYYREPRNGFEILLAHGAVRTVQLDSKVQIEIEEWELGSDAVQTGIRNQEPDVLKRLIIRPSISRVTNKEPSEGTSWDAIYTILSNYQNRPESEN